MTSNSYWGDDWPSVRSLFPLNHDVVHCNHASYGVQPIRILEERLQNLRQVETSPDGFHWFHARDVVETGREHAAAFLETDPDSIALTRNVTSGIDAVLRSFPLGPDDEVLITDHSYPSVVTSAQRVCGERGANLVIEAVPLPHAVDHGGDDEIVEAIIEGVSARTALAVIDHVTAFSACRFPIERIVEALQDRGVAVCVDAAHAPGTTTIDFAATNADFWVGSLHKWCFVPRGASAVYCAPQWRHLLRPASGGNYMGSSGFPKSFEWTGTDDLTGWQCIPSALAFGAELGWDRIREHGFALASYGQQVVSQRIGVPVLPHDHTSMALVPLPSTIDGSIESCSDLRRRLLDEHRVEVAIFPWRDRPYLRLSAAPYNSPRDYELLATALATVLS